MAERWQAHGAARAPHQGRQILGSALRGILLVLLVGLGLALDGRPALAATLTVTNTAYEGPGSLHDAVTRAASGETIQFAPNVTGRIRVHELSIAKHLTIKGPGAATLELEPYIESST